MASKESQDNGDFDIEYYKRTGGRELQEIKMIPYIKREVDNFKERTSRYMMILNMLIFLLATTILILHCLMQGGSDGSGRQSCKCNYVDITKMPGPHADTARVMPGAHADIAHTVCVKPGPYADTVCVKPGPHADIN